MAGVKGRVAAAAGFSRKIANRAPASPGWSIMLVRGGRVPAEWKLTNARAAFSFWPILVFLL
jgi:hypothetical protein